MMSGKIVKLTGNKRAKGRAKKRPTWTVKDGGKVVATTPDQRCAEWIAAHYLAGCRSVSIYDNEARKVVGHWIYGHRQK